MTADRFAAAVAAEVLSAAESRQELLTSIVDVARAIFLAEATSVALLDAPAREFVFQAMSGRGARDLLGARFNASQGLATVVMETGEPLIVDDLTSDPRFARDVAEETGYVPNAMMVAPLLREERALGALWVLDRGDTGRNGLQELQLLSAFATQAALALDLGEAARRAARLLREAEDAELNQVAALARKVGRLEGERRAAAEELVGALVRLLD